MIVQPFEIPKHEECFEDLRDRIARTRWPSSVGGAEWKYGFNPRTLVEICSYWQQRFNWAAQVEKLSAYSHFRFVSNGGLGVHFLHIRGRGPKPVPIVLTHGWPGSFLEMLQVTPLLCDPAAHGGDSADAFDVIVPSLPGFGYSDKPLEPGMNVFRVADLWAEMMTALGYERFAVQGGDIGAGVCTALGLRHPERVIGIHLNYIPGSYRPYVPPGATLTSAEEASLAAMSRWFDENGAYAHVQRTRPQTLAVAMTDSPVGLAAWVLEKFREWSDCEGNLTNCFELDDLLANVTLYWVTETIASSFRMYCENRKAPLQFRDGEYIHIPCAFAHFPKEIPIPSEAFVRRGYNIQRWTEMACGGHFAAWEQPELLARDIRDFFRNLRQF